MKLSTVFELLLIFLIISFAASRSTDSKKPTKWTTLLQKSAEKELRKDRQTPPNRYCSCSNLTCNCCRDFSLPVVPVSGPGCASLKYVQGDSMLVTMSFGERVLQNVTISGKKPKPICMNLPGGISKFCGRVYGISRDGDQIRACLGLELRALDDVEAALRVSCFKLGPNGLNVEPGKPLPTDEDEDDDDDDDDDDFELPGDDDDDDEEDDDDDDDVFGLGEDDESENAVESGESDYGGFSALSDEFIESFFESDSSNKKKKPASSANKPVSVKPAPTLTATTSTPAKTAKPPKIVATKLALSTPSKVSSISDRVVHTTHKIPTIDKISTMSTIDKVYLSPTQYKPAEKIRPPSVKQPLESYIPTVSQLSTERIYTSPQQISTDKIVYMSTINQYHQEQKQQPQPSAISPQEHIITNLYVPTTQQFPSTERVFMPMNLSTMATATESAADTEPVTSTSMIVNVIQSNSVEEAANETKLLDKATEMTPDSEYNEVDSDTKTTIDTRYESSTAGLSTTPLKPNRLSTVSLIMSSTIVSSSTEKTNGNKNKNKDENGEKEDEDDTDFEDVVETAVNVFGSTDEEAKKNETSTDDSYASDVLDSDEDSDESEFNQDQQSTSSEYGIEENEDKEEDEAENDDEDKEDLEDDDDDDFRKLGRHTKKSKDTQVTTITPTTSAAPAVHNGREHKRMNLPPLFSQKPEISSFWSSGGHLYKIRMSPVVPEQSVSASASSFNRLGRLNLFVPAVESYPMASGVPTPSPDTKRSTLATDSFLPLHRFKLGENNRENNTDRSRRNHKLMRISEDEIAGRSSR